MGGTEEVRAFSEQNVVYLRLSEELLKDHVEDLLNAWVQLFGRARARRWITPPMPGFTTIQCKALLRCTGCPTCSSIADGFNGIALHLASHDVMLWAVSRAPLEKLQAYKRRMRRIFPWASPAASDFTFDFTASITEKQQKEGVEYNYRHEPASGKIYRRVARIRRTSCHDGKYDRNR